VYGIFLILIFFGCILYLNIYNPKDLFNLKTNYSNKKNKSDKLVVEQSIKGVYLVDSQKDDTNWELWAESGLSSSASSSWRFNNVKVNFYTKDKKVYKVMSEIGLIDLKEKTMTFEGEILIESPNGYFMKAETLSYNFKDKVIFTDDPVAIDSHRGAVNEPLKFSSESMKLQLQDSKIFLDKINSTKTIKKNKLIKIKSDKAVLSGNSYRVEYKKNVKLKGLGFNISSDRIKLYISKKRKQINNLTAIGNVLVTSGDRIGQSGLAKVDFKDEVIEMLRSPSLKQGKDVLYGERIIFYNKTKSVAVKKARAKVDKNKLETYNEPINSQ